MPVTIGPFTNVPAPGDPVASAWAQQITQALVDVPGGVVGFAEGPTSDVTGIGTTHVELASMLGMTWLANHYYLTLGFANLYGIPSGAAAQLLQTNQSDGTTRQAYVTGQAVAIEQAVVVWDCQMSSGATVGRKLKATCSTGTMGVRGSSGPRRSLLVSIDLGTLGGLARILDRLADRIGELPADVLEPDPKEAP